MAVELRTGSSPFPHLPCSELHRAASLLTPLPPSSRSSFQRIRKCTEPSEPCGPCFVEQDCAGGRKGAGLPPGAQALSLGVHSGSKASLASDSRSCSAMLSSATHAARGRTGHQPAACGRFSPNARVTPSAVPRDSTRDQMPLKGRAARWTLGMHRFRGHAESVVPQPLRL